MGSVCIYGGGNIAHSLVAAISAVQPVTVITRRPESWDLRMAFVQDGEMHEGLKEVNATSDASAAGMADIIFIALPQFAVEEAISSLLPNLKRGATVVFVPAPAKTAEYASRIVGRGCRVVGLQRVPFISRIIEYGHSVSISLPRPIHKLVVSDISMRDIWSRNCKIWFGGDAEYLSSFLTFAFSNSNPLLHPSRLVVLFENWRNRCYAYNPPFYGEWTDESSKLYIAADMEMFKVMSCFPEIDLSTDYESVLSHYEVKSAPELTVKIRSIPSFKMILSPMKDVHGRLQPDFGSRYFTEDVPYGTKPIVEYANQVGIRVPTIDYLAKEVLGMSTSI